jgi:hypothetical protein
MAASDRLTALDATFLELEQSDDSALMHIGAALVFDALAGGAMPAIGLSAPRTGGLAWPCWEQDRRFEIGAHVRHATLPSPGDEREFLDWISDFYSHRLDRSRPCGRSCCWTVSRAAVGRWCGRPITVWSTASVRSASSTCCSTQNPYRASPQRPTPRQRWHPMRSGTDGCLIHRSLSARRPAEASPRLAPGRTR